MKNVLKITVSTLFIALTVSGCYLPMTGTIIDAETKAPIEGAVVLVEWTKVKGIGFTYTESYKVAETKSDKNGKFHLPGCICVGTDEPDVTIYKKGYVAWNNKFIFPGYRKRLNITEADNIFAIEHIPADHSYVEHMSFIRSVIHSTIGTKPLMSEAFRWEELKASSERDRRN